MKKGFFGIILSLELVAILIFTIAGWQADRALDKSGIGDPEIFSYWNNIAGISFYTFVGAWVAGVIILILIRRFLRQNGRDFPPWAKSNVGAWLPPMLLSLGWFISVL